MLLHWLGTTSLHQSNLETPSKTHNLVRRVKLCAPGPT